MLEVKVQSKGWDKSCRGKLNQLDRSPKHFSRGPKALDEFFLGACIPGNGMSSIFIVGLYLTLFLVVNFQFLSWRNYFMLIIIVTCRLSLETIL